jgi:hypothetical protein
MPIINCNCRPEPKDDKLYLLIKLLYKDKVHCGVLEFENKDRNKTYFEQQGKALLLSTVRTLLKQGIISE